MVAHKGGERTSQQVKKRLTKKWLKLLAICNYVPLQKSQKIDHQRRSQKPAQTTSKSQVPISIRSMQIDPVFSNQRFATSRRTDTLPLQRCRQCYQSTEHTCPPTYPKHVRIGSCTKKLEQIFDFSFFWQDTVLHYLPWGKLKLGQDKGIPVLRDRTKITWI